MKKLFVEVKNGGKMTYSVSDLNKLDRMYETEVFERKEKRVMSPFKKEMQKSFQAQVRDYAFEKILDRHLYTFKYMLVIPDPYGVAKQTALILFNSSKEYKVVYRVLGDTPDCDFTGETGFTTRHRVPILGLYGGRNNKIDLKLVDKNGEVVKHRMLQIYVSPIQENIRKMVSDNDMKMSHFGFILLNTAIGSPVAIDGHGDVRYSLQIKTGRLGMIPLANGHFLLVDKTANRVDKYGKVTPCRYHEIDYMGRVYKTYLLEHKIGRAIAQHGESLFFITSSDDEHLSDRIAELNLNTGELVKYCDIHALIGEEYRQYDNWIDTSYIEYNSGKLLITAKRLNSVINIDWNEQKIEWIIAPPQVWKDSKAEKYVLKDISVNDEKSAKIPICSFPEYTSLMEDNNGKKKAVLFDIRNVVKVDGKVIVPGGKRSVKNSLVKIIDIDENDMSLKVEKCIEVPSSIRFSRVLHSEDEKYLLVAQGYLRTQTGGVRGIIQEIDAATGEKLHGAGIKKVFSNAWPFAPDIKDYCVSMEKNDNAILGKLNPLEKFEGIMPALSENKTDGYFFGGGRICDDLFLCNMRPGTVDKIYFIGEKHSYVKDMENVKFVNKKEGFAIPLNDFEKDEYHVYVEYDDEVHKLKNEIRIIK